MSDQTQIVQIQVAVKVLKIAGAAAIGFFFLVLVMIATAQQDVLSRMKSEGLSVSYSSALALRQQVRTNAVAVPALEQRLRNLSSSLESAQTDLDQAQNDFDLAWEAFKPSVGRLMRANLCDLPQASPDTPAGRAAIANEVQQCQLEANAGPRATRILDAAKTEAERFVTSAKAYFNVLEQVGWNKRRMASIQAQLEAARLLSDDQQKAVRSFGDMDVLLQPWVLFGHALVQFPPPLLQILLTFVSGLFGALLVTLILLVYPNSNISSASAVRPVARTFLGGFIALCVYIVLLSGTAVLGAGNSSNGAGTNYMAFCGIGILAGMFSDRVAGWLSERADELFKRSQHDDDAKPEATT